MMVHVTKQKPFSGFRTLYLAPIVCLVLAIGAVVYYVNYNRQLKEKIAYAEARLNQLINCSTTKGYSEDSVLFAKMGNLMEKRFDHLDEQLQIFEVKGHSTVEVNEVLEMNDLVTSFDHIHGKGTYAGIGKGFATCKKIIEAHAGEIAEESTLGAGSVFSVRIPKVNRKKII